MTLRLIYSAVGSSLRVRLCSSVGFQGLSTYPGTYSRHYSQHFLHRPIEESQKWTSLPHFLQKNHGIRLLSTANTNSPPSASEELISQTTPITDPPSQATTDIFETSSRELWANDAVQTLAQGETFASLGLGGYSPVGLLQSMMELIYSTTGMPWWGAIVASTLGLRVLFYPLSIFMQKNAAKMHKVNPQIEKIKERQENYQLAGNMEMANHERNQISQIHRENGVRPILSMLPAGFQAVLMISFFMAIRGMSNAPVATMATGGALWFPDLTVPDPIIMLPVISSAGFLISLELGGDAGVVNPQMARMKNVMRLMTVVMIGITCNMPAGIFMYWLTASSFSICNALLLKVPRWRALIGIGEVVKHPEAVKTEKRTWNENRKIRILIDSKKEELKKAQQHYKKLRNDPNPKLFSEKPPLKN